MKWALLVEKWSTLHDFNDTFDILEEELITWDTAPHKCILYITVARRDFLESTLNNRMGRKPWLIGAF